jgi:hypothetical protein
LIRLISDPADISPDNLIGRIIVQGVIPGWPSFRHAAKVIEINGVSALAVRLHANYSDADGLWLFTDHTANDRQIVRLDDVRAVCDSAAEANLLIKKSRESVRLFNEMKHKIETEFVDFVNDVDKSGSLTG